MNTIYAIRDRIAETLVGMRMYTLLNFKTDQEAARYFADAINDKTSILNKHPADYELIKCGAVEDNGNIIPFTDGSAHLIITGDAVVALQQETT